MKDTPYSGGPSRRLLTALGIVVVVVVAFLLGRVTSDEPTPQMPEAEAVPNTGPGPTQELNGVPVGYAHNEDGAIAAAANFARVMSSTDGDDQAFLRAYDVMAAPRWREEARALAEQGLEFTSDQYGPKVSLTFTPVRHRLVDYSPSKATVAIWGVTLASVPTDGRLEESWVTGTLQLEWVADDWKLSGGTSRTGPTPELLQDDKGGSPDALRGFQEFERAATP